MTHFAVAVISDGRKTVEDLLAPYQEDAPDCCLGKWDWHVIGGRFRGQVKAVCGGVAKEDPAPYENGGFDWARLGDMLWSGNEAAAQLADDQWRSWVGGETMPGVGHQFYKRDYYIRRYGERETYVRCNSTMWWRAVVTPDGKWHEVGEVGWFGCSSETSDELAEWVKHFKERFIDPYSPECTLTVVDCHI